MAHRKYASDWSAGFVGRECDSRCVVSATAGIPTDLRELARLQAGVISRRQALSSGVTPDAVKWAVRRGSWQPVHPGIYATFTGQLVRPALLWAAVLHAGAGAVLSHQTAAELLGLTDRQTAQIHVTIPHSRKVIPPPGMVVHSSRRTIPKWRFEAGTPPHTMPEDTVIDLVNTASNLDEAVGWITAAFARRLTGEYPLRQALAARHRVRWRGQLDEIITLAAGGTHSALEFRYDRDVERAHGLPPARRQAKFVKRDGSRGFRDRYYEQYGRLVIELDGRRYHQDEYQDRVRDNQAAAGGGSTLRYDWDAVTRRPCETADEVFDALRRRGYQGALRPCSPSCRATGTRGIEGQGKYPAVAAGARRA
jgi:hypothetical protein